VEELYVHTAAVLTPEEREAIVSGLIGYNADRGFTWASQDLSVVARDGTGALIGGLLGHTNVGWLFVAALWVADRHRQRGLGGALLAAGEAEASRRGCIGVYLDTYSFQAKPFYERLGYEVFGQLTDCPPGATKYYLSKRLAATIAPEA
jgi:predicted N-acetyltransferase YhbS